MMLLWLILAYTMQAPPAVKTKMVSLDENSPELTGEQAITLKNQLAQLAGVIEAVVLPQERTVILKIDRMQSGDEAQLQAQVHTLVDQL